MNHLHAISKLYHVAAILGSRPFVRYFTHNQCVFDITSERLHGWLRSQFCQGAGTALDLKSDDKALFKNIARELTSIAKEAESYGDRLTEKHRNCHVPRNTDFVHFYQSRFGMEEVFEWIDWYNQADPALRSILAPAKTVLFTLARYVESRNTLTHGVFNQILQGELRKLLVSKGEDWLIQGLPHDLLAHAERVNLIWTVH